MTRVKRARPRCRSCPIVEASISTDVPERSSVVHSRTWSRPVTTIGSPLNTERTTFSASPRHAVTVYQLVGPSIHCPSSPSRRRTELASRKLHRGMPSPTDRNWGSVATLPWMVTIVSLTVSPGAADRPSDPRRPPRPCPSRTCATRPPAHLWTSTSCPQSSLASSGPNPVGEGGLRSIGSNQGPLHPQAGVSDGRGQRRLAPAGRSPIRRPPARGQGRPRLPRSAPAARPPPDAAVGARPLGPRPGSVPPPAR